MANGILRPEARPGRWKELNASQRDAVLRLLTLLSSAVGDSRVPQSTRSRIPWVDRDRVSRLAFLSGKRGTGKTTVMVSVVRAVDQGHVDLGDDVPVDVQRLLGELKDSVVWLEPIDAEPATEHTNLLAAIVARIEAAALAYTASLEDAQDRRDERRRNEFEAETSQDKALAKLHRVQTKLALAWGRDGIPRTDADVFAVEVLRRERSKLGIQQELNDALSDLGKTVFRPTMREPIFVLPVDDIDLNPLLCVELIKLIREIAVPRLFAITLGDIELTDFVMQLKYAADFQRSGADLDWVSVDGSEVKQRIADVAAQNLRKLVPVNQRLTLSGMQLHEVLQFCPLGSSTKQGSGTVTLASLLDTIRFPLPESLKGFSEVALETSQPSALSLVLAVASSFGQRSDEKKRRQVEPSREEAALAQEARLNFATYSGKSMLQTSPRRLTDLWHQWRDLLVAFPATAPEASSEPVDSQLVDEQRWRVFADELLEYWCAVASEESGLARDRPAQVRRARGNEPVSRGLEARLAVIVEHFRVVPRLGSLIALVAPAGGQQFLLRASDGWDLVPRRQGAAQQHSKAEPGEEQRRVDAPPAAPIDDALVGTTIVVHDVIQILYPHRVLASLVEGENTASPAPWAVTSWPVEGDEGRRVEVRWPAPICATVAQWDWFLSAWGNATYGVSHRERDSSGPASVWLLAGTSVLDGRPLLRESPTRVWASLFGEGGRLEALLSRGGTLQEPVALWLLAAATLLLPEFGAVDRRDLAGLKLSRDLANFYQREALTLRTKHLERIRYIGQQDASLAASLRRDIRGPEAIFRPRAVAAKRTSVDKRPRKA